MGRALARVRARVDALRATQGGADPHLTPGVPVPVPVPGPAEPPAVAVPVQPSLFDVDFRTDPGRLAPGRSRDVVRRVLRKQVDFSGSFTVPAFGVVAQGDMAPMSPGAMQALRDLARRHNDVHGHDPAARARVPALRAVYRRGLRASGGDRVHGFARVRAHLRTLATGRTPHGYEGDTDLLPRGHVLHTGGRRVKALVARQVKAGMFDPQRHPRDMHGRFITIGSLATAVDKSGRHVEGEVVSHDTSGRVVIRDRNGGMHTVGARSVSIFAHPSVLTPTSRSPAEAAGRLNALYGEAFDSRLSGTHEQALDTLQRTGHARLTGQGPLAQRRAEAVRAEAVRRGMSARVEPVTVAGRQHLRVYDAERMPSAPPDTPPPDKKPGVMPRIEESARSDGQPWGSGYREGDPRSDPAYDRYAADLNDRLDYARTHVGDTEHLFDQVQGAAGAYRPERVALHRQIIADLLNANDRVPRDREAVVLAGPSGAGKTTLLKKRGRDFGVDADPRGRPRNFAVVNADDMKDELIRRGAVPADYRRVGVADPEAADLLHEESSHLADLYLRQLRARGVNLVLDGTFAGKRQRQLDKVDNLRAAGYTTRGVLVDGGIDRSLRNVGARHRGDGDGTESSPFTGRYVPYGTVEALRPSGAESAVFGRPHRSTASENFEAARDSFNGGTFYFDNAADRADLVHSETPRGALFGSERVDARAVEDARNTAQDARQGTGASERQADFPDELDRRLVDYKPDRALSDPSKTERLDSLLPNARHTPYSRMPFIDELHRRMGVEDPARTPIEDYTRKRDALFQSLPQSETPLDRLVVTQPVVNRDRVQQIVDHPETGGSKPQFLVRHGGETYVINGHHRIAALVRAGQPSTTAHTLDLDAEGWQPPRHSADTTAKAHPASERVALRRSPETKAVGTVERTDAGLRYSSGPGLSGGSTARFTWPSAPGSPAGLDRKAAASAGTLAWGRDDNGLRSAIVAVTGIVDEVEDIIHPRAFDDTLRLRIPKGVWSHDWDVWVSRTEWVEELLPGDPRLPARTRDGSPWPKAAGALAVSTRFNLDTQAGREALSNVDFFDEGPLGPQTEWCVDADTQILTGRGWLRYTDLGDRDEVYTLDPATLTGRFEPLLAVNVFPEQRRTLRLIETGGFSSLTTLGHRWPVAVARGGHGSLAWQTTERLNPRSRLFRCAPHVDVPTVPKWSDALVEVVAWFWTEGWWRRVYDRPQARLAQSLARNPQHVAAIRAALQVEFPGAYGESGPRDGMLTFALHAGPSALLADLTGQAKEPTAEFLRSLTAAQLRLLIERCLDGDGTRTPGGQRTWFQVSPAGVAAFEMACALAGLPTNTLPQADYGNRYGRPPQRVSLLRNGLAKPLDAIRVKRYGYKPGAPRTPAVDTLVEHDGIVWCPTTPSGTWLARRRGSVYFTGNSIGYAVRPGRAYKDRSGVRHIIVLDVYEYGPTLFGAMPLCGTLGSQARESAA